MNDNTLVDEWIADCRVETQDVSPASEEMYDAVRDDPERAWRLILAILRQDKSDLVVSCLAAGPLEDLLGYHGQAFIDRVERLAQTDSDFNTLLGGVWRNSISEDIWQRVTTVRRQTW